jgi:hypothetical protein
MTSIYAFFSDTFSHRDCTRIQNPDIESVIILRNHCFNDTNSVPSTAILPNHPSLS